MDYPGKVKFVAASISREDFSRTFDHIDSSPYCGRTWRVKREAPRLDITSFICDNPPWVLGTFGALKFAVRLRNLDSRTNKYCDNPGYIADLARARALPFKAHPASPPASKQVRFPKSHDQARGAAGPSKADHGPAEPTKADKKALVAAQNAQRHLEQKAEAQQELQAMIMAAVSRSHLEP